MTNETIVEAVVKPISEMNQQEINTKSAHIFDAIASLQHEIAFLTKQQKEVACRRGVLALECKTNSKEEL